MNETKEKFNWKNSVFFLPFSLCTTVYIYFMRKQRTEIKKKCCFFLLVFFCRRNIKKASLSRSMRLCKLYAMANFETEITERNTIFGRQRIFGLYCCVVWMSWFYVHTVASAAVDTHICHCMYLRGRWTVNSERRAYVWNTTKLHMNVVHIRTKRDYSLMLVSTTTTVDRSNKANSFKCFIWIFTF